MKSQDTIGRAKDLLTEAWKISTIGQIKTLFFLESNICIKFPGIAIDNKILLSYVARTGGYEWQRLLLEKDLR